MYELIPLTARTYSIDCPAKLGIYLLDDRNVLLIDSGNDKQVGRKVQKLLEQQNWTLQAILNTHAHADHIGGNAFLQERLGVPIFAPGCEAAFANHPQLESALLFGGYPPAPLRGKFFWPQKSVVQPLEAFSPPDGMEFLPLPGHFFEMTGLRTPDGVWFLADALSGTEVLEKYHIAFLYDVAAQYETLSMLERLEGDCFLLSHAPVTDDLRPLIAANRAKMDELVGLLLTLCETPRTGEELLRLVFERYRLQMNVGQHALVGSTLRSYLSYLSDRGALTVSISDNRLLWARGEGESLAL